MAANGLLVGFSYDFALLLRLQFVPFIVCLFFSLAVVVPAFSAQIFFVVACMLKLTGTAKESHHVIGKVRQADIVYDEAKREVEKHGNLAKNVFWNRCIVESRSGIELKPKALG